MKKVLHERMFQTALLVALLSGLCAGTVRAGGNPRTYVPVRINKTYLNHNMVNVGEPPTECMFYSKDYHSTGGLTTDLKIGSYPFEFEWTGTNAFEGNDCIKLDATSTSQEVVLPTPTAFYNLYFLTASINGGTSFDVTVKYEDDTTSGPASFDIANWCSSGDYNVGRIDHNEYMDDIQEDIAYFSCKEMTCDGSKKVKSITFTFKSALESSGYSCIFAITGWTDHYDLNVTSAGWASLYLPYPVFTPTAEGVEVYYASSAEGNTVTLTQITELSIPANTGVLVKANPGTVKIQVAQGSSTLIDNNLFEGVAKETAYEENSVYVLSGAYNGKPLFQNYTGSTLGAYKAYLPKSAVSNGAGSIEFRFDDANAIEAIEADDANVVTYNLLGQPVPANYRGFVIRNGRKVLNR